MSEERKWVACLKPLVGDVLRWNEPIWAVPNKPRGKRDKIGEQQIIADLLAIGDFLEFKVVSVVKISGDGASISVKENDEIRRKRSSIDKGLCHKLDK